MQDAKRVFELDFQVNAKRCWKSVRDPSPSPVNVILNLDESSLLAASPRVLHSELWKVWASIFQRAAIFSWPACLAECDKETRQAKVEAGTWSVSMLRAKQLMERSRKMDDESSIGPDG